MKETYFEVLKHTKGILRCIKYAKHLKHNKNLAGQLFKIASDSHSKISLVTKLNKE